MRFYTALIASLLSNHRGVPVIGGGDVLSAERRYETTKGEGERKREKKKNLEPGRIFERVHARFSTFGNERLPDESGTERGRTEAGLKYAGGCEGE